MGQAEAVDTRANRTGVADGAEAVDRSHPRNDTDGSYAREQGAAAAQFTPSEVNELNSAVSAIEIRAQRLPDAVLVFSGGGAVEEIGNEILKIRVER